MLAHATDTRRNVGAEIDTLQRELRTAYLRLARHGTIQNPEWFRRTHWTRVRIQTLRERLDAARAGLGY